MGFTKQHINFLRSSMQPKIKANFVFCSLNQVQIKIRTLSSEHKLSKASAQVYMPIRIFLWSNYLAQSWMLRLESGLPFNVPASLGDTRMTRSPGHVGDPPKLQGTFQGMWCS